MGRSGGFSEMGQAVQHPYGLCHSPPPELDLATLLQVGYTRLVYLADDLPRVPQDMVGKAVGALRLMADLLASDSEGTFDKARFNDAMVRLASTQAPPDITGAALALALRAGLIPAEKLVSALKGDFLGAALEIEDRIGVLRGILATAPALLWQVSSVLDAVDSFLTSLQDEAFLELLPALRRAFTALNPKETDRLAERLAQRHSAKPDLRTASQFTEADLLLGLQAHQAMMDAFRADGLEEEA